MNIKKFFSSASVCRQGGFFSLTFLGIVFILISCDIAKTNGLAGLSLSPSNLTIPIGEEREITADFSPANAIASITWSNSRSDIIELTNMSGNKVTVIAKKVGTADITAEADGITDTITVTVKMGTPNNITVATNEAGESILSWNSSAGAGQYLISVSNDGFEIINHINSGNDNTSLTTNNLNFLTRYTATIQACDNSSSYCSSGSTNFVLGDNGKNLAAVIAAGKIPANLKSYDDQSQAVFGGYTADADIVFRYIATNGSGNNTGSSWSNVATSLKTVLERIDDASVSKVYAVLIGPGTYLAGATMAMKNYVTIVGGVPQNTSDGGETILSGNNKNRVFNNTGLNNTARLYGVTIANGKADIGGGMYNLSSSPVLTRVVFFNNTADSSGGGMYNTSSSPILTGVVFSSNMVTGNDGRGGGMYNYYSSPILTGVVFSSNTADEGGGMFNLSSSSTVVNSIFWGNSQTETLGRANVYYSIVQGGVDSTRNILSADPGLGSLADNGGGIPTMAILTNSPAVDQGLYVKRSGSTHYYSIDNSTWYTTPKLGNAGAASVTLPTDAIDLTAFDMTGYPVTGRPDIGVYEAR